MFDLYLQITVALLLAFLLGFLIAKMWVQNRRHEYLAKITQLKTKLTVEEEFKQQQTHRIELLQDGEQQLTGSMNELTSIKTTLNIEITTLNKNLEDKQNNLISIKASLNKNLEDKKKQYLEDLIQLETKLTTEEEFKQQQAYKIELLEDRNQQIITSVDELTLTKTALEGDITQLNKTLEDKQVKIMEAIDNKEKIVKQLAIESTQNKQLTVNLQLAAEKESFLNSQIETLSKNYQNTLKTIDFMEDQATTSAIQQDQLQQSLQESTQQYESMDGQISILNVNEKEALEKIHDMEKKNLGLQIENKLVEEEKTDYCDKLFIAHNEQTELEAHALVRNYTFSAISVAIIPIPFIDLATLLGVQIIMLDGLAEKYEIDFSENKVKSLVFPLLSSTLSLTGAVVFSSFIKVIPGIGQASGIVSLSILAGTMTYAVGEIFIEHFESGGAFLDFDVEKQKIRFKELYEKGKQMLVDSEAEPIKEGA